VILDTIYLLLLVGVAVKNDLLRAIVEGRVESITLNDLAISQISLFEIQVKSMKLRVPVERVIRAIRAITSMLEVILFYSKSVIKYSFELYGLLGDYVDSVIVATAISTRKTLITEDKLIPSHKSTLEDKYKIKIYNYNDILAKSGEK
jgi:PIN domain nuclease of toxin-antitoxin system